MQGERTANVKRRWQIIGGVIAAAGLIAARRLLWQAAVLLFLGMMMALAALPVMKWLEKRLSSGTAAALSMAALGLAAGLALVVLVPALVFQARELIAMLPALLDHLDGMLGRGEAWLQRSGITQGIDVRKLLLDADALSAAAPRLVNWMGGMAGSLGQWMLAPVFAFYFLRDRKRIAQRGLLLLPVHKRALVVRILREMRRETAGYLRGQLMVSAIVGALTAAGLLFCGIPAWLALGAVMGLLELIPYVGPLVGGVMIALFALPQGIARMLWALGVVIVVQQAEGSMLSPQLISDATRLHPAVVILCVALGGAAAGIAGILLSVPLVLCIRAALRVIAQERINES